MPDLILNRKSKYNRLFCGIRYFAVHYCFKWSEFSPKGSRSTLMLSRILRYFVSILCWCTAVGHSALVNDAINGGMADYPEFIFSYRINGSDYCNLYQIPSDGSV
jgi:hypothetical protein